MSSVDQHCVIVGAGHACAQLCASLRDAKWGGRITVVGDEPIAPYHRPPLSKSHLDHRADTSVQMIRPLDFYRMHAVELLLGQQAQAINRQKHSILVAGEEIFYSVLVLAMGSIAVSPPIDGIDHPRVLSLRTADDAAALRASVADAQTVAVIGAGFIPDSGLPRSGK